MTIIEKHIVISAAPEAIFRIYRDVENWSRWDPDTKSSSLNNGLVLGSKGTLTPAKGNTIPMVVTSIQENKRFTVTSKTALFRMDFDHELEPTEGGTRVIHRVKIAGFLKPLLMLMLVPKIEKGLPVTLQRLKAWVETTEVAASKNI
jgi:hypothetical protein